MNALNYIGKDLNGESWENICISCYRLRYQTEHFTPISASEGGDAGIEGFTHSGIVIQCYCPEKNYTDDEAYEKIRDKMTTDIGKLLNLKYRDRLVAFGVPTIKEWHLVIPEQKDSRIVKHAETKRNEVLNTKSENPDDYQYISEDFKIVVKCANDFAPEIAKIILSPYKEYIIQLDKLDISKEDISNCESDKVSNVKRKVHAIIANQTIDISQEKELVELFIKEYLEGKYHMNELRITLPEVYEQIFRLERNCKEEAKLKILLSSQTDNHKTFNKILDDFENKLRTQFSESLDVTTIDILKRDLIASWLADCSLEFRS